jgi:hypothetical protein
MANDNQGSRTFLAIVLGGIVLALVIAAFFMYGGKETQVKVEQPVTEQPAAPPAEAPAPPAAETPAPPSAETPPAEAPAAPEAAPQETPAPQNP